MCNRINIRSEMFRYSHRLRCRSNSGKQSIRKLIQALCSLGMDPNTHSSSLYHRKSWVMPNRDNRTFVGSGTKHLSYLVSRRPWKIFSGGQQSTARARSVDVFRPAASEHESQNAHTKGRCMNKRLIWVEGDDFTGWCCSTARGASPPRISKAPSPPSPSTASPRKALKNTTAQPAPARNPNIRAHVSSLAVPL